MIGKLQVIGLVLALSPLAAAQTADPVAREMIEKLLARIDTLEKRLADLEKDKPGAPANAAVAAAAPGAATPSVAQQPHLDHDQAPPPEAAQSTYPALKISGFADVSFRRNRLSVRMRVIDGDEFKSLLLELKNRPHKFFR